MNNQIGVLDRCGTIDERRIAFYKDIGLDCIQLAGVYEEWLAPNDEAKKATADLKALLQKYDIAVPTMFFSYPNQWSNEFGLVPARYRAERIALSCRQMEWGRQFGAKYFACHVGFVPEEKNEFYDQFILDLKMLARFAAINDQYFMFETGTETVAGLKEMIEAIDEPNVGINFDPANFLYYNNDDPALLVDQLVDKILTVHCKDAVRPAEGEKHGKETVLGQGATNFRVLLKRILDHGFNGPLIIERELAPGPEQEHDFRNAVQLIKSVMKGEK